MTGASREQLRTELLSGLRWWYTPWLHLVFPSTVALGAASVALTLGGLGAWELACVPLFLLLANAMEWHGHHGVLHRRVRGLEVFYQRHVVHHAVFVAGDMVVRGPKDLALLLQPALALPISLTVAAPFALALAALGLGGLGALWFATVALHFVAYEWVHLACHLPAGSWPGRLRIVAFLREHHRGHHGSPFGARWNLNVTLPLWDLVRGTYLAPGAVPSRTPVPTAGRRTA